MISRSASTWRWLLVVGVLALIIGILVAKIPDQKSSAEPQVAPEPAAQSPVVSNPVTSDVVPEEEILPELSSLESIDLEQAPARRELNLQNWTTSQGARVYFMQAEEVPMLDVQILFAAGSSRDGELLGQATMTNGMLNEGTEGKDAGAIARGFERLGAQFSNSSHRDMALASLRSLTTADKLDPALALFAEVVTRPSFPEDAFQRLRNQLLAGLKFRLQSASALASEAFWAELYPNHPYGTLPEGQPDTLMQLTPATLREFHQRFYTSGNAVISMVGAIDRQQAERIAERLAEAMPQGPAAPPLPIPEPVESEHTHLPFNAEQTHILVGQRGITRKEPDYVALYVGNQILGGSGFGSRLMKEIREQRGLSYSVSSSLIPMAAAGPFLVSMQTRADQVPEALAVIDEALNDFISNGPTEAELARTKRQILGEFPLSTASNAAIIGQLGMIGFYNLPLNHLQLFMDQVEALTTKQIQDAFAEHLAQENRLVVTVGPEPVEQEGQAASEGEIQNQEPAAVEDQAP
ncbi:MAG TPA: insulinase family protein [Pseudomonas xinjiangensis]|uniref:Insulinase family protein n=2 Tax=root TaxID=1 RepID=A0A7V1BN04_9GAMM|nr:insulinase family protein [Halopseudomonas xinjiangensis]HEC49304.1 insulinase family protein [Halopseudomonas xinjiangensis]